jgi:hypothetical protein
VCVWALATPQALPELIVFVNNRSAAMDAVLEPYTRPPYNVRVMGDGNNYGITWPLTWLIGNATNEHVLFLEKDFQLVESLECAVEQLRIGVTMLQVTVRCCCCCCQNLS